MTITIEKFSTCNKNFFELACQIRTRVFVEEQNVPIEIEYDGLDDEAVHYLLFVDGKPAVCSRYRGVEGAYKLERFATLKEFRRKGLGAKVLLRMLEDIKPKGKEIYLNSQDTALGFYQKYGFETLGEEFYEADIKHFKMIFTN